MLILLPLYRSLGQELPNYGINSYCVSIGA